MRRSPRDECGAATATTTVTAMIQSSPTRKSYQNRPNAARSLRVRTRCRNRRTARPCQCDEPIETANTNAMRPKIAVSPPGHSTPAPSAARTFERAQHHTDRELERVLGDARAGVSDDAGHEHRDQRSAGTDRARPTFPAYS